MAYEQYMHSEEIGKPVRFKTCPFCKKNVSAKGFVVTRVSRGYIMWCHLCHARKFVPSGTPSASDCLDFYSRYRDKSSSPVGDIEKQTMIVRLPYDFSTNIPSCARMWLEMYGVSEQEMSQVFGWSEKHKRLIMCVRNRNGKLLYWSGRYFGAEKAQPKYLNVKSKKAMIVFDTKDLGIHHIDASNAGIIIVVEDIVSALAVARSGFQAIALLGSYLDDQLITTVLSECRLACVWLDSDKRCESAKSVKRMRALGVNAQAIIHVDGDPKDYSTEEIKQLLNTRRVKHEYQEDLEVSLEDSV